MRRQFITNSRCFQPPFSGGSAPRLLLLLRLALPLRCCPRPSFQACSPALLARRVDLPCRSTAQLPRARGHPRFRTPCPARRPVPAFRRVLGGDTARLLHSATAPGSTAAPLRSMPGSAAEADVEGSAGVAGRRCRAYSRDGGLRSLRAVAHFSHDIGRLFMYNAPALWLSHTYTFTRSTRFSTV